jgi:hypothetical protein
MHPMDQGDGRMRDPWDRDPPERDFRDRDPRERDLSRRPRGGGDPLDQRVDRWVTAGRQFVEGVAGARPGGRPAGRGGERRPPLRPRIDDLGRWVEGRLDWLLDDGDDWREPWQDSDPGAPGAPEAPAAPVRSRRPMLEAVSRRGRPAPPSRPPVAEGRSASASAPGPPPAPANGADDDWPDDDSFTLPRWQRPEPARRDPGGDRIPGSGEPEPAFTPPAAGRPLPRSSRRRA